MSEWAAVGGRLVPGQSRAVWNLPEGEFCYIEGGFDPGSIAFKVSPTTTGGRPDAR